jgi:transposase
MSQEKYIGMDVHQATISVAVMDSGGKLIMECILETKAGTILEFIQGVRGSLSVTFEEGTCAAWLHDLLHPHVSRLVVCDPRKNALLKDGSKSDRIDARKLAELLRGNQLSPVYHGDHGVRTLKELGRSYLTLTQDLTRVMSRIKALYRSWAIPCSGTAVYATRHRSEWLAKIPQPGVRLRAQRFYQQLDLLQALHQEGSVRFVLLCWWPCCKRPSVSVPSDNYGRTAGSPSKLTTAASTATFEGSCVAIGNASASEG